jgi:DNA-binding SARP family transcriptional activator
VGGGRPEGVPVEFRILGPLEVIRDGTSLPVSGARQRTALAVLLLNADRIVTLDRLIDAVWDGDPPATAKEQVRNAVAALRRLLDGSGAAITTVDGGYRLDIGSAELDVRTFERLVASARTALSAGDREGARALFRSALELWRGPVLAGTGSRLVRDVAAGLSERRLAVFEERIEVELASGRHREVLGELADMVAEHPVHHGLVAQLMVALYRCGRPADALEAYRRAKRTLADELGLDVPAELAGLEVAVLRGDPALAVPDEAPAIRAGTGSAPAQLPADLATFTGRAAEVAYLLDRYAQGRDAVVICAIDGMAGVGKTALAVYVAHRVADRFPDGQLYVNLRGFDPSGQAVTPGEAVRRFLDALGVPTERIPVDVDAQAALYRSTLAGRRMLVVLDNARDSAQVRPLLPAAPGCLVLVTSRNQLTGLVAADGAHPINLDVLSVGEARELLARRLGEQRIAAEPDAVEQIVARCARLPLALALVAARAAARPRAALHMLAGELTDARQRWQALTGDDPHTDVRAVFSWSYRALSPAAARLFRLLGLHPGPDIGAPAAASLAGITPDAVRPLLAELTRASLLAEPTPGRFTFHDLLRAYATQLAHTVETDEQRHAAIGRILDHYLHTAYSAARLLDPARDPISLAPPRGGVTPQQLTDHAHALGWVTGEHQTLLAAVAQAAATGFDIQAWQLTWSLWTFLDRGGHWHDWVALGQTAVAAAQRLADPATQATCHRILAGAYTRLGRLDDAHSQLHQALDLADRTGDQTQQAHTHHSLVILWGRRGQPVQSLLHARQALRLYQAADHQDGQARALNAVGWCHTLLGEHEQALTSCQQAFTLYQQLGDRDGQANTLDSLGHAHHHLGQHPQAIACYEHALSLFRDLGDRYNEATTLTHLGDTHHAIGDRQAARDAWQQALAILDELDHADAAQVRAKLADLDPPHRAATR